jgi:hypothetical protein
VRFLSIALAVFVLTYIADYVSLVYRIPKWTRAIRLD